MHFRPIEQSMEDEHLAQGRGGNSGQAAAPEDGSASGGVYFSLDDVFGPETEAGLGSGDGVAAVASSLDGPENSLYPSDMRRLETEHTTAGYREGISAAKERTIQAGFDEGFSLGAAIGLAAGQLLGILEGIEDALKNTSSDRAGNENEDTKTASKLLAEAREELSVPNIFSSDYWAPDGNWTYDVNPEANEDDEVLFADVAKAHPLIRKWTDIVDERVKSWKIDRSVLDGEAVENGDGRVEAAAADDATTGAPGTAGTITLPPPASRQRLEW
ncbi:hypothetical protein A9Z42_0041400 [Trichoderma parareesei]|uniref:Protein YAE1 n=1 Tax=Trichoderma parareesei TaxID=858221 RepID=A0A2H2Z8N9_TRIPA|nr:hypothetical protein A9Z42_0041400 [Trichoderma parareesei]